VIRALESDPDVGARTWVSDAEARELLGKTMGRLRRLELLRMRVVVRRPTQRLIRMINRWRLGMP
jgi:hypothetical protein